MLYITITVLVLILAHQRICEATQKPNIILIVADDMGWNDIGFHGSDQIPTPNIDALFAYGVALNRFYTTPMCSPSRSSLMTGKYPSHLGMQHYVIVSDEPFGLSLSEKLLPQYLKDVGYATHIIGKWHLGFYMRRYTPCERGFDGHFGYLGAYIDYFNHSLTRKGLPTVFESGYDMRNNFDIHYESKGIYATDLFADVAVDTINKHNLSTPLFLYLPHLAPHSANSFDLNQAPSEEIEKFVYIKDEMRRKYAAMVSKLDQAIARVLEALHKRNMLHNSVVMFMSDNGAPSTGANMNMGSNWPLRGQKDAPWEGALRVPAAVWSPLIRDRQRVSNEIVHITDLLPTISYLAGFEVPKKIDGNNVWSSISFNDSSDTHKKVLCYLDTYAAIIVDDWKLISGTTYDGIYDGWLGELDSDERHSSFDEYGRSVITSTVGKILSTFDQSLSEKTIDQLRQHSGIKCGTLDKSKTCNPLRGPCLFHIYDDPCEMINLAESYPEIVQRLLAELHAFNRTAAVPRNRPSDERSNPKYFNGTWTWWYDELGLPDNSAVCILGSSFMRTVSGIVITGLLVMFCR